MPSSPESLDGSARPDTGPQLRDVILWEWNAEADEVIASNALRHIYGTDKLTTVSEGFGLVHPDDAEPHHQAVLQAVERNRGYRSIFRIVRPQTGEVVWIDEHAEAVPTGSNLHPVLIGFAVRITPDSEPYGSNEPGRLLTERCDDLLTTFASEIRNNTDHANRFAPGEWIRWASRQLEIA